MAKIQFKAAALIILLGLQFLPFSTRIKDVMPQANSEPASKREYILADTRALEALKRDALKEDLAKVDSLNSKNLYAEASVLVGQNIRTRQVYKDYLNKAAEISQALLNVENKLAISNNTLNLQQLGAVCQQLELSNQRFKAGFSHGEDRFQTYQLIETAMSNLKEAVDYWRISNRYRRVYRGGNAERATDQAVLKVKLLTAQSSIAKLKEIRQAQDALSEALKEE